MVKKAAPRRVMMKDGRRVKEIVLRPDLTDPNDRARVHDLLFRSGLEHARRRGEYRRVVFGLLHEGIDPSPEDVAAALREPVPDSENAAVRAKRADQTARLMRYVAAAFVLGEHKRRKGRKRGERTLTTQQEAQAAADYFAAIENLASARDRNSQLPRPIKTRVLRKIAGEYGIKEDTMRALVKDARPIFSRE
jgi:hypothetical protein